MMNAGTVAYGVILALLVCGCTKSPETPKTRVVEESVSDSIAVVSMVRSYLKVGELPDSAVARLASSAEIRQQVESEFPQSEWNREITSRLESAEAEVSSQRNERPFLRRFLYEAGHNRYDRIARTNAHWLFRKGIEWDVLEIRPDTISFVQPVMEGLSFKSVSKQLPGLRVWMRVRFPKEDKRFTLRLMDYNQENGSSEERFVLLDSATVELELLGNADGSLFIKKGEVGILPQSTWWSE